MEIAPKGPRAPDGLCTPLFCGRMMPTPFLNRLNINRESVNRFRADLKLEAERWARAMPADQRTYMFAAVGILALVMCLGVSRILVGQNAKQRIWADGELDSRAALFFEKAANFDAADYCVPVHVGQNSNLNVFYMHCSDQALDSDLVREDISDDFEIPDGLERRVHFWRRVYSLWSIHNYVVHVGRYPEVIFEIADASHLAAESYDPASDPAVRKAVLESRNRYRQVLLSMHFNRNDPRVLENPTMRRIAQLMRHIDDKEKYLNAAQSLRVQRGQMEFVKSGIEYSSRYLEHIEGIFRDKGLPPDLAKVAFVESSFNIRAQSRVGAAGVYQIMPETGMQYMIVSDTIDERLDPIKAGDTAARLFQLYYQMTGAWPLAITAYNHGVGSIRRAVQKAGTHDIVSLIDHYDGPAFGFASKNFYAEFLAMLATLKRQDELFRDLALKDPLTFEAIRITKPVTLLDLARAKHVSLDDLRAANPDLKRSYGSSVPLPRGYTVKIPRDPSLERLNDVEISRL